MRLETPEESDAGMMYDEVKAGELVEIGVSVFEVGSRVKMTELLAESAGDMLGDVEGQEEAKGRKGDAGESLGGVWRAGLRQQGA